LAAWFVFHETANLGTDRAKVHQSELLGIPFPEPADLPDEALATVAAGKIVALVDDAIATADEVLMSPRSFLEEIDGLVFKYFGLSEDEIAVVEDTLDYTVPAMQPRVDERPAFWTPCGRQDRIRYAETLTRAIERWLLPDAGIAIDLVGIGADLAALRVRLLSGAESRTFYCEAAASEISDVLNRIWDALPVSLPGNFQIIPDLRIFLDDDMYMVKPRQLRYWLRSSALADADEVAADLHQASTRGREGTQAAYADR